MTRLHGLGSDKNIIRSTVIVGTDGTNPPLLVLEKVGDESWVRGISTLYGISLQ